MSVTHLRGLAYRKGRSLTTIPAWARFFLDLGTFVATTEPGRRLVVGASLPARGFAAAFCAAGVNSAAANKTSNRTATEEHFAILAALPAGTPLRYRRGAKLCRGDLLGVRLREGVAHLHYFDHRDKAECYLPWDRCGGIEPITDEKGFVHPRPLVEAPDFVRACRPDVDPYEYASFSNVDCVVVGTRDALEEEICNQDFVMAPTDGPASTGSLNDLLRCDAFRSNPGEHFHTAIVSPYTEVADVPAEVREARPLAVVFDGPSAFLRGRSLWPDATWIALLDRTSPSVMASAEAFNQELAMSVSDADLRELGAPPPGIELSAFLMAAR